jgi:predicted ArsR family transcriptional regulator
MATLQQEARALGDVTRHAIFRYIAGSDESVDIAELAETFRLNQNAIRQHLAKLLGVALIRESIARPGRPGRPRLLYEISPGVESRWGVTGPYERLSQLLCEVIRTARTPIEIGREAGRALSSAPDRGDGVDRVASAMLRQGFEPTVRRHGDGADIVFGACPFATTALADPDIVCELHLGLAEGAAAGTGTVVDGLDRENPRSAGCCLHLRAET